MSYQHQHQPPSVAAIEWEQNWIAYIGPMPGPKAEAFGNVIRANTNPAADLGEIERAVAAVCDDFRGGKFERQPGVRDIITAINAARQGTSHSSGDRMIRLTIFGFRYDHNNPRDPWEEIPLRRMLENMRLGDPADRISYLDRAAIEGEDFHGWLIRQAEAMPGGLDYGNPRLWYRGNPSAALDAAVAMVSQHSAIPAAVTAPPPDPAPRLPYRDDDGPATGPDADQSPF